MRDSFLSHALLLPNDPFLIIRAKLRTFENRRQIAKNDQK